MKSIKQPAARDENGTLRPSAEVTGETIGWAIFAIMFVLYCISKVMGA